MKSLLEQKFFFIENSLWIFPKTLTIKLQTDFMKYIYE